MRLPSVVEVAGNAFGKLGAAVVEHVLERLQPGRQHLAHGIAPIAKHLGKRIGALAKLIGHPIAALHDGLGDARAVSSSLRASPPRRLKSSTSKSPVFFRVLLTSSTRLEMVSASRLPVSTTELGELFRAIGHHVQDRLRFLREPFGDAVEPH